MTNIEYNSQRFPLTVVIPTLGNDSLLETIQQINSGLVVPDEILICIPNDVAYKVLSYDFDNIRVVATSGKGQVQQRSEGFKSAKHKYVLQMDDDILLSASAIKIMIKLLGQLGVGNVIGPAFYDPNTSVALHKYDFGLMGFFKSLNASLFSAAPWGVKRMGKVTRLGIAYGIDPGLSGGDIHQVDWLPGGCVLSFKEDLIDENFFPLSGKAFSEDVIHSILRTSNKIKHHVAICAKVNTVVDDESFSFSLFITELKARLYVVELLGGNKFRLFIWSLSQLLTRKLKKK